MIKYLYFLNIQSLILINLIPSFYMVIWENFFSHPRNNLFYL